MCAPCRRLSTLAGLALLLGTGACDRLLSVESRIERAAESFETGRYDAAMNDAKSALESEPENVAARLLLARISLRIGDVESARKELDRAIAAGGESAEARQLHYDIMLREGRYQDALIAAAADEDMDPVQRQVVIGTSHASLGQFEEAGKAANEALKLDKSSRKAGLLQARLDMAGGRFQESDSLLDDLVARDAEDAEAWLFKARLAFSTGDAREAEEAFAAALRTGASRLDLPDLATAHAGLIESRMAQGNDEGAEAAYRELRTLAPEGFVTRYLGARLAMQRGDSAVAVGELQRALNQQPRFMPGRLLLATALLDQGSTEQAESELTGLLAEQPDNLQARRLLARIYLARGDATDARRLVADMPAGPQGDATTDWFAGAIMSMTGARAEGLRRFEAAASVDPDNVPLKLDLTAAYLAAGRREEATQVLASIPDGDGGLRRRQLEIVATVIGQDPEAARRGIDGLARQNPKDADLLALAGLYLLNNAGDAAGAATLLERALALTPGNVEATLGLAEAAHHLGDSARATALLQRAIEAAPRDERAYVTLSRMEAMRGNHAQSNQLLERAIGAEPAAIEARLQLADFALADGDQARMKSLAEQALSVAKNEARLLDRIGALYMRASLYDDALVLFNQAANKGQDEAGVNAALALRSLGREDEARARLESIAGRRQDWLTPVAHIVAQEIAQGRFDAALERVAAFQRAGGEAAQVEELRGDVQRVADRAADATASYQRAFAASPSAALAIKLFRVRRAAGVKSPEASLRQWLGTHPRDPVVRMMLAEQLHARGDRKAAVAEYERVLAHTASPAALNNLAWLYHEAGDARAEAIAKRAYDAMPQNPAMADTYGWILVEKGKVQEGLPILEKAAAGAAENREIQYHYATALVRAGRREEAAETLRKVLGGGVDLTLKQKAEQMLKESTSP
ncbi:MAG: XrtA/PEP-CTERM system TPR-repeat protein PrsT [Gammaproteobacteria bacterium]